MKESISFVLVAVVAEEGEENTRNGKWVELYSKLFIKYPYFFQIVLLLVVIFSILVIESLTISNVSYLF